MLCAYACLSVSVAVSVCVCGTCNAPHSFKHSPRSQWTYTSICTVSPPHALFLSRSLSFTALWRGIKSQSGAIPARNDFKRLPSRLSAWLTGTLCMCVCVCEWPCLWPFRLISCLVSWLCWFRSSGSANVCRHMHKANVCGRRRRQKRSKAVWKEGAVLSVVGRGIGAVASLISRCLLLRRRHRRVAVTDSLCCFLLIVSTV